MQALLANPQVRRAAANAGLATVRFLGNSRQRRANRGGWYFGKKMGIPAKRRKPNPSPLFAVASTSAPVARSGTVTTNPTTQNYRATGADWLVDVAVPNDLAPYVDSYSINPAESSTFARLSNIASQYQKYVLNSITLRYVPSCPTTQKGTLYLAPLRDPTSLPPQTVLAMRGLSGCKSCAVRDPMTLTINKAYLSRALNGFYCEPPDGVTPDQDNALRTCGRLCLMLDGVVKNDGIVGTLSMTYDFQLSDPKTVPEGSALGGYYKWDEYDSASVSLPTTTYDSQGGRPALTPFSASMWRKRHVGPMMIMFRATSNASDPTPVIQLLMDGDLLAASEVVHHVDGVRKSMLSWLLPAGKQFVEIRCDTISENVTVDAISVSSGVEPGHWFT